MLPMKATMKAVTVGPLQGFSANVAPVTSRDSPSAMMTNSAQRSARWAPSIFQSCGVDRPRPGTHMPTAGDRYSMPIASAHSTIRCQPSSQAPASQKTPARASHRVMRWKLR